MAKKLRSQTPPKFTNYKHYKPFLRVELDHSCCWCDTYESETGGARDFHVEHYLPKKKFPHLETAYDNLLYACQDCNGSKLEYYPKDWFRCWIGMIVLNPFDHDYTKHLDQSKAKWNHKSAMGWFNIAALHLNADKKMGIRKRRETFRRLSQIENKKLLQTKQLLLQTTDPSILALINQTITDIENNISHCDFVLGRVYD